MHKSHKEHFQQPSKCCVSLSIKKEPTKKGQFNALLELRRIRHEFLCQKQIIVRIKNRREKITFLPRDYSKTNEKIDPSYDENIGEE
ncbi:hypothetical protein [Pajaroellobacter abortibovis]|uniref:Uncharacterized protein n=1 Tax=Pajaroellobacter abortibovis TaxID=1882918 RepID=A0A1L6MW41_9BACT|nr:hypothetical protein [Pajaroellobacter abortibovis]APR99731.1 hypothetical protein BCY86_02860 [Pajaroellobacter abortibovis]